MLAAHSLSQALGEALLHSLWQITAVAAVFGGISYHLRSAQGRYLAGCLAVLLSLSIPVGSLAFALIGNPSEPDSRPQPDLRLQSETPAIQRRPARRSNESFSGTFVSVGPTFHPPTSHSIARGSQPQADQSATAEDRPPSAAIDTISFVWMIGVCLMVLRPLLGAGHLAQLWSTRAPIPDHIRSLSRKLADEMGIRRVCVIQASAAVVPCVIGILRPIVFLPPSMLTGYPAEELRAILAHELAHIRRHDYLVNLMQSAIETLLFFHPAIWWMSTAVRRERENCCDDAAVAVAGRRVYARALLGLREATPPLVLAASGGSLFRRIERVLSGNPPRRTPTIVFIAAFAAAVLAVSIPSLHTSLANHPAAPVETVMTKEKCEFSATPAGICEAARAGDTEALEHIAERAPQLITVDNPHNWTTTAEGHDIVGSYNKKPVEVAAFFGQARAVALLLRLSRNSPEIKNQPTGGYFNSLRIARVMGHERVVEAIEADVLDRIRSQPELLRDTGARKDTLLFYAAQQGHMPLVRRLLESGAEATPLSEQGRSVIGTVLDGSGDAERRAIARLLVERGAEVTLWVATAMEDVAQIRALLARNPALAKEKSKWSECYPLVRACQLANREIIELLLDHGADVNADIGDENPRDFGMPIMNAMYARRYDLVNLLLDRGASVRAHPNCDTPFVDLLYLRAIEACPELLTIDPPDDDAGELIQLYHRVRQLGGVPFMYTHVKAKNHREIERLLRESPKTEAHNYGRGPGTVFTSLCHAAAWLGDARAMELCLTLQPDLLTADRANENIRDAVRSHNREGSFADYRRIIELNLSHLKQRGQDLTMRPLTLLAADFLHNYRYSSNPDLPCMKEMLDLAGLFLDYGANIDERDPETQHTPLSLAVRKGHEEYVEFLLRRGASTGEDDPSDRRPLALAEQHGFERIERLLRTAIALRNDGGETPYDWAVRYDAPAEALARLKIENEERTVLSSNNTKLGPASRPVDCSPEAWQLYCAAANGDEETVRHLITDNPALMHEHVWYECPLHYAVRENQIEVVRLLLTAGINPAFSNFTYSSWQSLLPIAADRGFEEIHKMLLTEMQRRFDYDPGYQPLWNAIVADNLTEVSGLIQANPRVVHIADEHGNRAIHWAVLARRIPMIELLLDSGADINARRADFQSPLQLAIEGDYWFGKRNQPDPDTTADEVATFLRDHGADYEFGVAVALGDLEHVKSRLAETPSLAEKLNLSRRSPLYLAARRGHIAIVRLLLESGADPNQREHCAPDGRALFEASGRNDLEMMKLLLHHGANADAYVDSCGNCLSIAEQGGDHEAEALQLLRSHGAMPGEWTLETSDDVAAALRDDAFVANRDTWSSVLGKILELDEPELLRQYVDRFGTDTIRSMTPEKGWRLPVSKPMLDALLSHGANVHATDWYGRNFLHYAAFDETTERAGWLLDAGIDIDAVDHESGRRRWGWLRGTAESTWSTFC